MKYAVINFETGFCLKDFETREQAEKELNTWKDKENSCVFAYILIVDNEDKGEYAEGYFQRSDDSEGIYLYDVAISDLREAGEKCPMVLSEQYL